MERAILEWVRTHRRPIDHYQVFGERRTGTNYLSQLIADNLELNTTTRYGWKHGFATMPCIARSALIVVVVRQPLSWLTSLHNRPFVDSHKALGFSAFLRTEWYDQYKPKGLGHRRWGYAGMPRDFKTANQLDRHPITGKRFKNPLEMRQLKNQSYLGFLERESNVVVIDYDTAKRDPLKVIEGLSDTFSVARKGSFFVPARVGPSGRDIPRIQECEISIDDLDFIRRNLDWEQETRLGYGLAVGNQAGNSQFS